MTLLLLALSRLLFVCADESPSLEPGDGTVVHGLVLPLPPTWTRRDDPGGAIMLIPPQLEGVQQYFLTVLPTSKLQGTPWESHLAALKALLSLREWPAEPVTVHYADAPGPFIRTSIAGKIAGDLQRMELYTAAHDGEIEMLIGFHGIDRNVTDPVLAGTTFKNPPKAVERPRIAEAYRRMDQKLYINAQGGAPIPGTLMYERLWLRADGLADFSSIYPEGYAASPLVFKLDPGIPNPSYGRWKASGEQIRITRGGGDAPEVYDRENESLRGGGKTWEPMPRVDGLKPAGRWGRAAYWIEFDGDGNFSVDGALTTVAFGDGRPKPPEKGSGSYEIRDWTLLLRFSDGRTWSSDFSILGKDTKAFPAILLRTTVLPRKP